MVNTEDGNGQQNNIQKKIWTGDIMLCKECRQSLDAIPAEKSMNQVHAIRITSTGNKKRKLDKNSFFFKMQ